MRLPKLPCGHEVPEEYQRYVNPDSWAFLTCRSCEPNTNWRLEPLKWKRIEPKTKKEGNTTVSAPTAQ